MPTGSHRFPEPVWTVFVQVSALLACSGSAPVPGAWEPVVFGDRFPAFGNRFGTALGTALVVVIVAFRVGHLMAQLALPDGFAERRCTRSYAGRVE